MDARDEMKKPRTRRRESVDDGAEPWGVGGSVGGIGSLRSRDRARAQGFREIDAVRIRHVEHERRDAVGHPSGGPASAEDLVTLSAAGERPAEVAAADDEQRLTRRAGRQALHVSGRAPRRSCARRSRGGRRRGGARGARDADGRALRQGLLQPAARSVRPVADDRESRPGGERGSDGPAGLRMRGDEERRGSSTLRGTSRRAAPRRALLAEMGTTRMRSGFGARLDGARGQSESSRDFRERSRDTSSRPSFP